MAQPSSHGQGAPQASGQAERRSCCKKWRRRRQRDLSGLTTAPSDRPGVFQRECGRSRDLCYRVAPVKARLQKTVTFSVSLDDKTRRLLELEGVSRHGAGLVTAMTEASRQSTLDRLVQRSGVVRMLLSASLLGEVEGGRRRPAKRRRDERRSRRTSRSAW